MDSHFTNGYTGRRLNKVLKFFEGCLFVQNHNPKVAETLGSNRLLGNYNPRKGNQGEVSGRDSHCHFEHSSASVPVVCDVMYVVGEKFGWEGHRPERAQTLSCTSSSAESKKEEQ